MKKLLPIRWTDGVNPEQAGKDTPHAVKPKSVYSPLMGAKEKYRVYLRKGRDTINISIKKDLTYEEYLDIWEKVQDLIVERQENE